MQSLRKKTRFFKMIFFSIPQVPQSIGSMSVMWAIAHLPSLNPKTVNWLLVRDDVLLKETQVCICSDTDMDPIIC